MANPLADARYATTLARPLARFELLLSAAVGFVWGPLLFHFLLRVADWTAPAVPAAVFVLTGALGWLGFGAPRSYFRLRPWERRGSGEVYVRWFGMRVFKRWMAHGDRMNASLRRRVPGYRVVRPTPAAAAAFAAQTVAIERAHLAWGLAALPILAYALATRAYGFATLWVLANAVTNLWPALLQRYNRMRAERVAGRAERSAESSGAPLRIRPATAIDVEAMHRIRLRVRENRLQDEGKVQPADYRRLLADTGRGWVAELDGRVVGFAVVDLTRAMIWALFVDPEFEERGIGRALHDLMIDSAFGAGAARLSLSTDPGTRAERFYEAAGWRPAGRLGDEVRFELTRQEWLARSGERSACQDHVS